MAFRLQRRISFGRHVRINVSKSVVSESLRTRGGWLAFGRRGTRSTVGLPGMGLSYKKQSRVEGDDKGSVIWMVILIAVILGALAMFF